MGKDLAQGALLRVLATGAFLIYCAWLWLPNDIIIDRLGMIWLPNRYWAVAVPLFLVTVAVSLPILAFLWYGSQCLSSDDFRVLKDDKGRSTEDFSQLTDFYSDTPIIRDLTPEQATQLLYLGRTS